MSRPRGFIEGWVPKPQTFRLINQVQSIIDDNSDILPLTLRQIFYMLVSNYDFDKTERDYKRLCEIMNKARRAQMIDMDVIRDDGLRRDDPYFWNSEEHLIRIYKSSAQGFRLDRQRDQMTRIMVWCEAGGMLPQLVNYCEEYGVSVLSSGGFDSVTTKHDIAKEISDHDAVEILHIGDHDPSGVHMHNSLDEDLNAFIAYYGGSVEVTRLAVTPHQVDYMNLPTAPPKRTDNRSFVGLTTQAEAIPPRRLKEIVQAAILDRMDMDAYEEVLEQEREIRASLAERLENL